MASSLKTKLSDAKKNKNDEFYTLISDIQNEMKHYREHFKNKVIFCNCDDPEESDFWKFFQLNFKFLELKKLIATHYEEEKSSYKLEMTSNGIIKTPLKQNGDFRSDECVEILKESDIVVTNPPFSLFREYVSQLIEYDKKFIIIGHQNAISYKEIFKLAEEVYDYLVAADPYAVSVYRLSAEDFCDISTYRDLALVASNEIRATVWSILKKGGFNVGIS